MLVLTRKIGDRIYIGKDIYITLLDIDHNKARIGIVAPHNLLILREELLQNKDSDDASTTDSTEPTGKPANSAQAKRRRDERI